MALKLERAVRASPDAQQRWPSAASKTMGYIPKKGEQVVPKYIVLQLEIITCSSERGYLVVLKFFWGIHEEKYLEVNDLQWGKEKNTKVRINNSSSLRQKTQEWHKSIKRSHQPSLGKKAEFVALMWHSKDKNKAASSCTLRTQNKRMWGILRLKT